MATVLDPLVGSCITKLQEIIADKAILILGVKQELKELQGSMKQIQFYLNDAEQRRIEESAVNNWLNDLRDAMYDADDIIDSARFEGSKLLEDHPSSSRNSTTSCGISFLSCFPNIQRRHEIAVKIRDLNTRIEKISRLGKHFLTRSDATPAGQGSTSKRRESSKLVEPNLVGKEVIHSSKKLMELVLANKENKDYKVAIVGTGGVGKTTLAQKIYNDQRIKGNFKKHAWVCVSQEYDEVTLLKEVLRNIGVHEEQGETKAELQSKVAETIQDKSFFLVLDDVWKSNVWIDLLRAPLRAAAAAVILVTTRDDRIAMNIRVGHTHRVDIMSVEVGWELLWKSMNIGEEKEVQHLRKIGIEIVRKCGYLPLAIKVTASILTSKDQTENEWKKILSKIFAWSHSKLPDEIEGALYMSYDELPHHLKQCFLYFALYPEDSTIHRNDLVRFWVAEGFVEEQHGELLEDTAEEYYYELIHRNLLQPVGLWFDHTECKMHDLLRQLACYLSREESFIGDPESLGGINMSKLRRLTVVTKKDILVLPSMDKGELKVRTIRTNHEPWRVKDTFFQRFMYVRVLDLSDSLVQSIPDYIRNLIHLRQLDLNGTNICRLPESIGSLWNLQILNLQRCDNLHSLPSAITQLCNLRRLGLDGTPINQVPKGIGRLEFLNDLEGFPIGRGNDNAETQDGWKLEELGQLSRLRWLDIIQLERAAPCSTDSLLRDKKYLKVLRLSCTYEPYLQGHVDITEKVFEQLIPPQNLEELVICEFSGSRYPTWLGTTHLSSVKFLSLINCNYFVDLPPLGQLPNLKYLKIDGAAKIDWIGPEFMFCECEGDKLKVIEPAIAFPKLEWLCIGAMPRWKSWSLGVGGGEGYLVVTGGKEHGPSMMLTGGALTLETQLLPRLNMLQLADCPMLRDLPWQLGQMVISLKALYLTGASSLMKVEDLRLETLSLSFCTELKSVSNLPRVRELRAHACPNLRCVEGLDSLQQLWLHEDMQDISTLWVPGLRQQRKLLHGEDLEVYEWLD